MVLTEQEIEEIVSRVKTPKCRPSALIGQNGLIA